MDRKAILFNLLGILLAFALAEVAVSLFAPNMPFDERERTSLRYAPSAYAKSWLDGPQEIWHQEGSKAFPQKRDFRINRWGYRGEDFPLKKPEGEVRILFLGGSHVFDIASYDYEGNPGFPALIEKNLQKLGHNVRVINGGIPGHSTLDMLNVMTLEAPRLEPDYIVFCSLWNDLKWIVPYNDSTQLVRTLPEAMRSNPLVFRQGGGDKLLGWSALYRKLRDAWWKKKLGFTGNVPKENTAVQSAISPSFQQGVSQYTRYNVALIELCRLAGAVPILGREERLIARNNTAVDKKRIRYDYVGLYDHQALIRLYDSCDLAVSSALLAKTRTDTVLTLDFNHEMQGRSEFFEDHVHLSPKGSRYLAGRYTRFFRELLSTKRNGNP